MYTRITYNLIFIEENLDFNHKIMICSVNVTKVYCRHLLINKFVYNDIVPLADVH